MNPTSVNLYDKFQLPVPRHLYNKVYCILFILLFISPTYVVNGFSNTINSDKIRSSVK